MQADIKRRPEKASDAEARVEMVARARGDLGFIDERPRDRRAARGIGRRGERDRVDSHGFHPEFSADFGRVGRHRFVCFLARREAEHLADLTPFLQVESENDLGMFLEFRDQIDRLGNIIARAFGRVGQVEENPARAGDQRHHFVEQFLENARHAGEHGPIDQRDEGGVVEELDQFLHRKVGKEVFPIHFAQAEVLAEHQFAIVELDRVGVTRFGQ